MRASKKVRGRKAAGSRGPESGALHISGAEGIYREAEIGPVIRGYMERAFSHSRGMPDTVVITVEAVAQRPERAPLLPVTTLECAVPDAAGRIIRETLLALGISQKALNNSLKVLLSKKTMRGASLIRMRSGVRAEPDRVRGIRVSRLGIEKASERRLSRRLSRCGINNGTVKEALILASKVAACPAVAAEVCVSDDPDYTTGYIASRESGYLRIPNIKRPGDMRGGRVFFIREDADAEQVVSYLEETPVLITDI